MGRQTPPWPTLDAQIEAAGVSKHSELGKLIAENQDFGLLEPGEATDGDALPLWVRVMWRKSHPELEHPKHNPLGGYPEVLYTIHQRIMANPDEPRGSRAAAVPPEKPEKPTSKRRGGA
ncbi:MAG: hypothetical protein H6735_10455 [Alphaproteobacteria bacterium]|nr:hypothetical protein [Alphaproteobacteria bacterium]